MKKSDITLRDFISKYVDYNTSCKLWIPYTGDEEFEQQLVFGNIVKHKKRKWKLLWNGKYLKEKFLKVNI